VETCSGFEVRCSSAKGRDTGRAPLPPDSASLLFAMASGAGQRSWLLDLFESALSRSFGYPTPSTPMRRMDHPTAFRLPCHDQSDCSLFHSLPGEVRDKIFTFALNCYQNPLKEWYKDTSYVRPGNTAPQVADVALLRTCQRIYKENCTSSPDQNRWHSNLTYHSRVSSMGQRDAHLLPGHAGATARERFNHGDQRVPTAARSTVRGSWRDRDLARAGLCSDVPVGAG
jgi:hypothetical protein